MANPLQRLYKTISTSVSSLRGAKDGEIVSSRLDMMIMNGQLDGIIVDKSIELGRKKLLDALKTSHDISSVYNNLYRAVQRNKLPEYGDPSLDHVMSCFWREEPILAGAVYSMAAKMASMRWTVTGPKLSAKRTSQMLSRAACMQGEEWGGFISASAQDFYTTNRGLFWGTPRTGAELPINAKPAQIEEYCGRLVQEMEHIDAMNCMLTGNYLSPVWYTSTTTSQSRRLRPGEFIHFSSMPSPREEHLGAGFCAVNRAYKSAKLLMTVYNYDMEKMNNLPPEGVAAVSGLTMDEFKDAIALWKAAREENESLTFPQILWLLAGNPGNKVSLDIQSFSTLPESFERSTIVEHYVNTLALDFGVDVREFWPVSTSSLGTAAESEIQHMKAKGKGPGEFITLTERHINAELPEGTAFAFDTMDIEEDAAGAAVAKGWIDALFPMTKSGGAVEEIITKDEFRRLLADKGILPSWMVMDDRAVVTDSGAQEKEFHGDVVCIQWDKGILKQLPLPVYEFTSSTNSTIAPAMFAITKQVLDDELVVRRIHGKPIPDSEAERGGKTTNKAITSELELWKKDPKLAKYVPDSVDVEVMIGGK